MTDLAKKKNNKSEEKYNPGFIIKFLNMLALRAGIEGETPIPGPSFSRIFIFPNTPSRWKKSNNNEKCYPSRALSSIRPA